MKVFGMMVVLYKPDEKAIQNIKRYQKIFEKIFIYDNTPGGCIKYKNIGSEQLAYYSNGENNGMSAALTKGFQWAKEQHLDFLLTMDQDSEFENRDIASMITYIRKDRQKDIAIYCPNYRRVYIHKASGVRIGTRCRIRTSQIQNVEFCMTSGSFVDVEKMRDCLPLDDLFIGMVDHDICYMLRLKGYKICMFGKAVLSQHVGETISGTWFSRTLHKIVLSEKRYYYMGRNLTYLMRKYHGCRNIQWQMRKIKCRIVFNLVLFEEQKLLKYQYWKKGIREKCPPFRNIG